MCPIVLLFAISLLSSYDAGDSDIVTPVFVQKGKDLLLDVMAPVHRVDRDEFKWRYNDKKSIIRLKFDNTTNIPDLYQGRVQIFQNYSLLLKNVKQADSGHYSAGVFGNKDVSVVKYSVTVQDPVSPVHGNVDSVSSSSDSCNLTVTCSTQDSHHINSTFRCDANTCSQDEGGERSKVTTSGASLRVYLSNDFSVICYHSNQVSSAEDIIMTKHRCFSDSVSQPPSPGVTVTNIVTVINIAVVIINVIVVIVAVVVVKVAIAAFVQHGKKEKLAEQSMDMENIMYKSVETQTPPDEA